MYILQSEEFLSSFKNVKTILIINVPNYTHINVINIKIYVFYSTISTTPLVLSGNVTFCGLKTFFSFVRVMSDVYEETEFQGPCMVPGKKKKKKSRKDPQDQAPFKTKRSCKKTKRKNSDPLGNKKEKKKDKKKKKRKISTAPDSELMITEITQHSRADPTMIHKTQSLSRHQDPEPKPKQKKKVAFDLSPGFIRVKRPTFVWSTPRPKESAALEEEPVGNVATLTQESSEDVNSQDLFITQKTFRAPSPEASSGETIAAPAPTQRQVKKEKWELEASAAALYGGRPPWSQTTERFTDDETRIKKMRCGSKDGGNGSWRKEELRGTSSERPCVHAQPDRQVNTSTQTENFFTVRFSSHLSFISHPSEGSTPSVDLQPLDLSLPQRARRDPVTAATKPGPNKANGWKHPDRESRQAGCVAKTSPGCLCSESGPRSADATASSGEEQPGRTKVDLTQVRRQGSGPSLQCVYTTLITINTSDTHPLGSVGDDCH